MKSIFMVFCLFLCCLLSVSWLFENMILNDLRFDFHRHFENQISNQIPIFQYDFKKSQNRPKMI
jgi:amino acid permease